MKDFELTNDDGYGIFIEDFRGTCVLEAKTPYHLGRCVVAKFSDSECEELFRETLKHLIGVKSVVHSQRPINSTCSQ